jgi:hypothetical protein
MKDLIVDKKLVITAEHCVISGLGLVDDAEPVASSQEERTKRLSIDMPESLHRRFKVACAKHGLSMLSEALQFFERRTTELEGS